MSIFFFFKQKTAYEMRISDWSSDVCSSDLLNDRPTGESAEQLQPKRFMFGPSCSEIAAAVDQDGALRCCPQQICFRKIIKRRRIDGQAPVPVKPRHFSQPDGGISDVRPVGEINERDGPFRYCCRQNIRDPAATTRYQCIGRYTLKTTNQQRPH